MAHKTLIDIKGYEGLYAVTPDGRVWSYRSSAWMGYDYSHGYRRVTLTVDGKKKKFAVHRLVAEAYIPNPNNLPCVNHKDECKTNNAVENLEWCTALYNCNYGTRNSKIPRNHDYAKIVAASKEKCEKPVLCVELNRVFKSVTEAAKEMGLQISNITHCCRGTVGFKTAGGYHWKYAEVSV